MSSILRLTSGVLRTGGLWVGARGSGKTIGLSRAVVLPLFLSGATVVCLDIVGTLTGDILWCLTRSTSPTPRSLWDDVCYVPMGGLDGHVLGTPFLAPLTGNETFEQRAMRPIDLWLSLSPQLENAPMLGAAKLGTVGRDFLMLLAAMGMEVVDAEELLQTPANYAERARAALVAHPWELAGPAKWYLETYPKMRSDQRNRELDSFTARVTPYSRDRRLAAQYGGSRWDVPLATIGERKRRLILFDGHGVAKKNRQLAAAWIFERMLELVEKLGPSRAHPIVFVIDELAILLGMNNHLLEDDFDRLVQLGRNMSISVVVAFQEMGQLSQRMQRAVLPQLGMQFYSSTIDDQTAEMLSRRFDRLNPHAIKAFRTQLVHTFMGYERQEADPIYYTLQEQRELGKRKFMAVPKLTFLAAVPLAEGEPATSLHQIDLAPFAVHYGWPDPVTVDKVRQRLVRLYGRPIQSVLTEIARRRQPEPVKQVVPHRTVRQASLPVAPVVFADDDRGVPPLTGREKGPPPI